MQKGLADKAELQDRKDRFVGRINSAGFDLAIVTSPLSVHYLTGVDLGGFLSPQALIFNSDGEYTFVVREIEMTWQKYWSEQSWCADWMSYNDAQMPYEIIAEEARALASRKNPVLGLELDRSSVPHDVAKTLVERIGAERVSSVTELIEGMRRIKSPTEIGFMREAGRIAKAGVYAEAEAIRNGGRDIDAVAAGYAAMLDTGADLLADQPSLPYGPDSARAHSHWTGGKPAEGDVVTFFLAGSFGRYQCPIERSFINQGQNSRAQSIIQRTSEAQTLLQDSIEPGMTGAAVDKIAQDFYRGVGLEEYRFCRIGYSIGIAYPPGWWENEVAQLRPNDDLVISPGMAFHIVPCLCVPGVGFVNRSMPTVVTESGCEPLIDLPINEQIL